MLQVVKPLVQHLVTNLYESLKNGITCNDPSMFIRYRMANSAPVICYTSHVAQLCVCVIQQQSPVCVCVCGGGGGVLHRCTGFVCQH